MHARVICVVLGLILVTEALGGPVVDDGVGHIDNSVHSNEKTTVEEALLKKLNTKCSNRDISSCMMLKLVNYFNRLLKKSSIEIGDVEITQTSTETYTAEDTSRSLNEIENMPEEAQISEVIMDKVWKFVRSRSLKWKVLDDADVVLSGNSGKDGSLNFGFSLRPSESANGDARKKKNNGMGAILGLAALKIGLLKALAIKALALLVGKALLVSKLALVLAAIIGLKKLFHQEKYVTYEVVAHPHHEHHHEHSVSASGHDSYGGGGWGRNLDAGDLAYKAYKPAASS